MTAVMKKSKNTYCGEIEVSMRKNPGKAIDLKKWTAKIGLVLMFTAAIFMYQGWYVLKEAQAAVAFDAASESHTGTTGSTNQASFTWTHTPAGTPRGVVVFVFTISATDTVTSVTYGGTAMTRLTGGAAIDTAGEPGRVDAFFLGASVPTGGQSVVVNRTNNATVMYAVAMTATAAYNTETTGIVLLQEDGTFAEQLVDDGSPGSNSLRFAGAYNGANSPAANGASSTLAHNIDLGSFGAAAVYETTAGQGARNVGFTSANDDRAGVHLAVREILPPTTTVGNGGATANKFVGPSWSPATSRNTAGDAFTLSTNSGTDTVTGLVVTLGGTGTANIATNGVKLYRDVNSNNEWDSGDAYIAQSSNGTFTGLSISVTTTATQYLVTYDIIASPTNNTTITGNVTAITCTNPKAYNDGTNATLTIDSTAPTTADNQTASTWQATEKTVTLTPTDPAPNSGVTAATGIYGCFGTASCTPAVLGGTSMTTACGAGNECSYSVRYYSVDNVGNAEATKTSIYLAQIDQKGPASGASFTATAGDTSCTLNWASTTDGGSGMHATQPYEVRWQQGSDPGSCTGGAQLYIGTGLTTPHSSLTNGLTYYYRLCYKDVLANQSNYAGNPVTCVPTAVPATPTRFYFPTDTSADVAPPITTWNYTAEALTRKLSETKGSSAITIGSQIGPWTVGNTALDRQYVSAPLEAQTISGTVKAYLMAREYNAGDNSTSRLRIFVVSNDGQTVRGTLLSLNQYGPATEYANVVSHQNKAFADGDTVTNVVTQNGDRLVVEIGHTDAAGATPEGSIKWGENAADCAENETGTTDCAGWIEFSDTITFSASGESLLHNSNTTGSSKWSGSWGVTGGRYGAITCETCHVETTSNIKRIKNTVITAPNTPTNKFPAEVGAVAPVFSRVSGAPGTAGVMGDDSTNPRTSSSKICEVCHTYDAAGASGTKYHAYSGGINNPAHANNGADCTGCHKHSQGFKAPACDSCHGNPPVNTSAGGPSGLANSPYTTGSLIAGSHAAHAITLSYGCDNCHSNQNMPQASSVKPGFGDISIGFSNWGVTTGAYSGQSNVSYNNVLGIGTKTCSTVYCHGSTINGPNTAAVWDAATGSLSCASIPNGGCHDASATNPPTLAAHQRHATNGTYSAGTRQGLNVACTDCHGATAGGGGHVNGSVSWSLNTANNKFSPTAAYKSLTTGSTGSVAPSSAYSSCTNIYCHSTVQPDGGTGAPIYQTIAWGGTTTCASCHSNQTSGFTGKHQTHTIAPYSYLCATCHSAAGEEMVKHADRNVDVSINATYGGTYGGTAAPGDAYGSCSSIYCHGNFTGGLNASPAWGGTAACGTCHGAVAATPPSNANHPRHAGTAAGQLGLACTKCHPAVAAKDGHVNLSVQWDLDRTDAKIGSAASYSNLELGSTGAKAPSAAYKNCTNVYCHSRVQNAGATAAGTFDTVTWGGGALTCTTACHTENPSTGSHDLHVTSHSYTCAECHNGAGDETALHANQVINMSFPDGGSYSQGSHTPAPTNTGYGTCSTTWCHGTNSGTWGTNTTTATCTKCHGVSGTSVASYGTDSRTAAPGYNGTGVDTSGTSTNTDAQVGAHDAHVRSLMNISSDIACNECHKVPTTATEAGHIDSALPAEITFGTLAKTGGLTPTTNLPTSPTTCTNTYCHAKTGFGGTDTSPTWNNSAYLPATMTAAACGMCHAYPPSGHAAGDCNGCHSHVNASAYTFNNAALHINGAIDSSGGDCVGCHAGVKGTAPDQFRQVTGAGGDFTLASRHVFGATVTNFDCIVCHAEGDTGSSGTTITRTSEHTGVAGADTSRTIAMRNVDAQANPGTGVGPDIFGSWTNNFWKWPKPSVAPTPNDHSNMDKFCMSCHDADGANTITVNATFNGMTTGTGVARRLTPFSKTTVGGSLTDFGARTRVLDVKTQFKNDATAGSNEWPAGNGTLPAGFVGTAYDGNPSQHAVLGPRYQTKNANLAGWTAGKTLKSGQALGTSEETSQLHCADCHSVDTNAHGSATANMLVAGTVDDTCYTCHDSGVYSATANAGSRVDHSMCGHSFDAGLQSIFGTSFCFNCHGGAKVESPYGAIHGQQTGADPNYAATYSSGLNPVEERYRFMGGMAGAWKTGGAFPGSWTGTAAPNCYWRSTANGYTNCARHSTGATGSKGSTAFDRALKY